MSIRGNIKKAYKEKKKQRSIFRQTVREERTRLGRQSASERAKLRAKGEYDRRTQREKARSEAKAQGAGRHVKTIGKVLGGLEAGFSQPSSSRTSYPRTKKKKARSAKDSMDDLFKAGDKFF